MLLHNHSGALRPKVGGPLSQKANWDHKISGYCHFHGAISSHPTGHPCPYCEKTKAVFSRKTALQAFLSRCIWSVIEQLCTGTLPNKHSGFQTGCDGLLGNLKVFTQLDVLPLTKPSSHPPYFSRFCIPIYQCSRTRDSLGHRTCNT